MFSEEKKKVGIKSFFSNTSYGFEYKIFYISKLSVKMFVKRKTKARKAYAYQMLVRFKTSVTYGEFF